MALQFISIPYLLSLRKFHPNQVLQTFLLNVIGYLDKYLAQIVAPDIDCGLNISGNISRIVVGQLNQNSEVYINLYCAE